MTPLCRIRAALTIAVVAGVTAGCSSPAEAPTAQPKSSASAPVTSPNAGKLAYCALLATAVKAKPPKGKPITAEDAKKFATLLEPAAAAASAAGKKDVADFLSLSAKMNSDIMNATAEQGEAVVGALATVVPILHKDCGVDILK